MKSLAPLFFHWLLFTSTYHPSHALHITSFSSPTATVPYIIKYKNNVSNITAYRIANITANNEKCSEVFRNYTTSTESFSIWTTTKNTIQELLQNSDADIESIHEDPPLVLSSQLSESTRPFTITKTTAHTGTFHINDLLGTQNIMQNLYSISHADYCTNPSSAKYGATLYKYNKNGMKNTVRIPQQSQQGFGVIVYVIDTGCDCNHPGISCNNSGYVCGFENCQSVSSTSQDIQDTNKHGTHCAGIVAGTFTGIAQNVTLVPIKLASFTIQSIISALIQIHIDHVSDPSKKRVVSMSLGLLSTSTNCQDHYNKVTQDLITAAASLSPAHNQLKNDNIPVVISAGNTPCPIYDPWITENKDALIVVGNADMTKYEESLTSGFSTTYRCGITYKTSAFGSLVDIFAPGTSIFAPLAGGISENGITYYISTISSPLDATNKYFYSTGTSMAAPLVAGVTALLLNYYNDSSLSVADIRYRLTNHWSHDSLVFFRTSAFSGIDEDNYTLSNTTTKLLLSFENTPLPTSSPTNLPSLTPTNTPSLNPTNTPSSTPTNAPSSTPTTAPSSTPTTAPSLNPTNTPSLTPTNTPSSAPTTAPSLNPTNTPSLTPTNTPSSTPTNAPSSKPTNAPSSTPTTAPSLNPTNTPSLNPTNTPSLNPTNTPSLTPTNTPSSTPTNTPSLTPTNTPSLPPTNTPSSTPTTAPSLNPTNTPSLTPTNTPSSKPTNAPSFTPTTAPSLTPTNTPSLNPTNTPSSTPTTAPSLTPTNTPSLNPTNTPSSTPTTAPSLNPTNTPSLTPTNTPSSTPTNTPSSKPTNAPSLNPTNTPSFNPTTAPSSTSTSTTSTSQPERLKIQLSFASNGAVINNTDINLQLSSKYNVALSSFVNSNFPAINATFASAVSSPLSIHRRSTQNQSIFVLSSVLDTLYFYELLNQSVLSTFVLNQPEFNTCFGPRFDSLFLSANSNNISVTNNSLFRFYGPDNTTIISHLQTCSSLNQFPWISSTNFIADWSHLHNNCFSSQALVACSNYHSRATNSISQLLLNNINSSALTPTLIINNISFVPLHFPIISTPQQSPSPTISPTSTSNNTYIYTAIAFVAVLFIITIFYYSCIPPKNQSHTFDSFY